MSDESKSLDILIRTLADTHGAEAVQQALNGITGATNKAAASAQDATKDFGKVGESTELTGKHIEGLNTHGREWSKLMATMNQLAPGLGDVMKMAFNPATIGIGSAVLLVTHFVKLLDDAKQRAEDMAKAQAELWNAQIAAIKEYNDAIATAPDTLKTKFDQEKAVLEEMLKLRKTLIGEAFTESEASSRRLSQLGGHRQQLEQEHNALEDTLTTLGGTEQEKIAAARTRVKSTDEGTLKVAADLAEKRLQAIIEFQKERSEFGVAPTREQALNFGPASKVREAIEAYASFKDAAAIVQKYDETKRALDVNSEALREVSRQIQTQSAVAPTSRQNETITRAQKLYGVNTAADLIPRVYGHTGMSREQQEAMRNSLSNQDAAAERVLGDLTTFLDRFWSRLVTLEQQMARSGNRPSS